MGEAPLALAWAEEARIWFRDHGHERGLAQAELALGAAIGNQGALDDAEEVLARVVAAARAAGDRPLLGLALEAGGLVAARRGDHQGARRRYLDEVEVWADVGSATREATGLLLLAHAARSTGDLDAAVDLSRRAITAFTANDNPSAAAHALSALADVARLQGDAAAADRGYAEARAAFQATGDRRCLASTDKNLAVLAHQRGEHDRAGSLFLDSMRLRLALGDEAGLAECLEGVAGVALATGQPPMAAVTLLGAASAIRSATGAAPPPDDAAAVVQLTARARAALHADAYNEAWRTGVCLKPLDAIDHAAAFLAR